MSPRRATVDDRTHDGRPMKYAHGEHAAYALDRCRCTPCREANTLYENERSARIEPAYVSAEPARQHILFLREHGMGWQQIARLAGISNGGMSKLIYGDRARRSAPSKRIRKTTLDRILAVTPAQAADRSTRDATETWKLIDEMVAAGVPKLRIAREIGQTGGGLQIRRTKVRASTARAIHDLHRRWVAGEIELTRGHSRGRAGTIHVTIAPPPREPDYADRAEVLGRLADILEARLDERSWRRDAACRNRPPHIWFPDNSDSKCLAAARKVCGSCLVRQQCLAANLDATDGIYAGTTPAERRAIRAAEQAPVVGSRPIEHNTDAGYAAHLRRGEEACDNCKAAHARTKQDREAAA